MICGFVGQVYDVYDLPAVSWVLYRGPLAV